MVQEFNGSKTDKNEWSSSAYATAQPIRLAMFSSGLGKINRGFEISTARFFNAVTSQNNLDLDVKLFAGADYPGAKTISCVGRNDWLKFPLNLLNFMEKEKLWKLAYALEQTSYSFGLIKESRDKWQPEVVWTKEVPLAHVLYEFRKLTGNPYKIIFANGGGFRPQTYQQFDFIQHLHTDAYEEALRFGIPASKMTVLPNIVPHMISTRSKADLRAEHGYRDDDWIVICVSAWNSHHKRIDHLINEVAKIDDPRCQLLICGQPEPEGAQLQKLGKEKLGDRVRFLTVPEKQVQDMMRMADMFALCSLYEGLGAVIIEAAMSGLPVVCHPHGGAKYILEDEQWMVDMSVEGALAARLEDWHRNTPSATKLAELKQNVENKFAEDKLTLDFERMVQHVYMNDAFAPSLARY